MTHAPPPPQLPGRDDDAPAGAVPPPFDHAVADLVRIRLDEASTQDVLHRVAQMARACVPGADEVSVTLVEDERPRTVASTGEVALRIDQRQYDLGSGPCLDVATGARAVSVLDARSDDEPDHPDLLPEVRRAGVRTITSVALPAQPRVFAGLNVYTLSAPGPDPELLRQLADLAAAPVANAALLASTTQLAEQLRQAMVSRAVIEQAKGLLVARLGCSPERAFDLLSEQSQQTNLKLRDIAVQLVREAQRSPGGPRG